MNALKKYQRITVVFLLLIGIVNYLDRSALSIANTSIQRDMLISPSQMGILLSAFSVAYAFAQLPLGLIIDRLGSKGGPDGRFDLASFSHQTGRA